jgi:hypothetical protein
MDNQNPQPPTNNPATNRPLAEVPPHPVTPAINSTNKPTISVTDDVAKALLTVNNLQAKPHSEVKLPGKLIFAVAALIVFVLIVTYVLSAIKPGAKSPSSPSSGTGSSSLSNPNSTNSTSNQINQDVKSCSSLVNATTIC